MDKSERPTLVFLFRNESPPLSIQSLRETVSSRRFRTQSGSSEDANDPVAAATDAFEQLSDERTIPTPIRAKFRSTRLMEQEVFAPNGETVVDVEGAVAAVRSRRDDDEVERMWTTVEIIEEILEDVFDLIEPGLYEREIEAEIKKRVMESDAEEYGVGIVTSGERTAHAHANTGTCEVEDGDLVMIDAGVVYEGY